MVATILIIFFSENLLTKLAHAVKTCACLVWRIVGSCIALNWLQDIYTTLYNYYDNVWQDDSAWRHSICYTGVDCSIPKQS